jgi:hypothetical protein
MTRPMLGFKSFWSAAITIAGIEIMYMIGKGLIHSRGMLRPVEEFHSMAEEETSTPTLITEVCDGQGKPVAHAALGLHDTRCARV